MGWQRATLHIEEARDREITYHIATLRRPQPLGGPVYRDAGPEARQVLIRYKWELIEQVASGLFSPKSPWGRWGSVQPPAHLHLSPLPL